MTQAIVPLADGIEEMEAVIVTDILRRAKWEVLLAGLDTLAVTASRGVRLVADCLWDDARPDAYDALVIPGGMGGVERMLAHSGLLDAVRAFAASGRTLAAICAAPLVLGKAGVLGGRRVTCHPAVAERLAHCRYVEERVVQDGSIITSQAAGAAFEFSLALIRHHRGDVAAADIAAAIVL